MNIIGNSGVVDNSIRNEVILSLSREEAGVDLDAAFNDPFTGIGFYSYVFNGKVAISAGHMIVQFASPTYGGFSILDSGIPFATVTGIPSGASGYVVLRYAQSLAPIGELGSSLQSIANNSEEAFGDPFHHYDLVMQFGNQTTTKESNTVNGLRYGYVFVTQPPEPSSQFFNHIICRVTTSASGYPTVYPVHIGQILVPIGYVAAMYDFSSQAIE